MTNNHVTVFEVFVVFLRKIWTSLLNLLGGTILPRFLFQKRYVSSAAYYFPVPVSVIVGRWLITIE